MTEHIAVARAGRGKGLRSRAAKARKASTGHAGRRTHPALLAALTQQENQ